MAMELKGKVIQILPTQTGMGKKGQWKKLEFIVETQAQYPKKVCLSAWGDKIDQFNLVAGEMVSVSVDLESREYNGRWYTEARACRHRLWAMNLLKPLRAGLPTICHFNLGGYSYLFAGFVDPLAVLVLTQNNDILGGLVLAGGQHHCLLTVADDDCTAFCSFVADFNVKAIFFLFR